jgi:hypothetical protein
MVKVTLIHPGGAFHVSYQMLVQKSQLFADDLTLTSSPYNVSSQVSVSNFREFVSALEGDAVRIKNNDF